METKTLSSLRDTGIYSIQPVPLPTMPPTSFSAGSNNLTLVFIWHHSTTVALQLFPWPLISPFSTHASGHLQTYLKLLIKSHYPSTQKPIMSPHCLEEKKSLKCYSRLCHLTQLCFPKHPILRLHRALQFLQNPLIYYELKASPPSRLPFSFYFFSPSLFKKAHLLEAKCLNSSALAFKCDIGQVISTSISSLINRDNN